MVKGHGSVRARLPFSAAGLVLAFGISDGTDGTRAARLPIQASKRQVLMPEAANLRVAGIRSPHKLCRKFNGLPCSGPERWCAAGHVSGLCVISLRRRFRHCAHTIRVLSLFAG